VSLNYHYRHKQLSTACELQLDVQFPSVKNSIISNQFNAEEELATTRQSKLKLCARRLDTACRL